MAYTISWPSQGTLINYTGAITFADVAQVAQTLATNERYCACQFQIINLEHADLSSLSIRQVQEIAVSDAEMSQMVPHLPSAVVTRSAVGHALAFYYQMVADAHLMQWKIETFGTLDEALSWGSNIVKPDFARKNIATFPKI